MSTNSFDRAALESAKIHCLATGVRLSESARFLLTGGGRSPLSVYEYPTTAGVTFELPGGVYVNAPFDEEADPNPAATLDETEHGLILSLGDSILPVVRYLPLPGYIGKAASDGNPVTDVAMSHGDRIRLSPITGCTYDCQFCDLAGSPATLRPNSQLLAAFDVARADKQLPARHALISGGSPPKALYDQFESACTAVIDAADIPVDIMMSPMVGNTDFLDRVVASGAKGFSINIEAFSNSARMKYLPKKFRTTARPFEEFLVRAVELLGTGPNVRSLIISGLEPMSDTLAGVEWLASLGVTPVLSPFRPGRGTALADRRPESPAQLLTLLVEARAVASHYGVGLGPACLPCQHNTLTFPWDNA